MVDLKGTVAKLYAANTLHSFWQLLAEPSFSATEWAEALQASVSILPQRHLVNGTDIDGVVAAVLGETLFGPKRWQLSLGKRLYYQWKPLVPRPLRLLLRQHYRGHQEKRFELEWPIEDRYMQFQFKCIANLLRQRGLDSVRYVNFWPLGHRFAIVLTHDVESKQGLAFMEEVVDLEESLGFRSVFNLVPERYSVDHGHLAALRQRGFEIGLHGLKHDGKLFSSQRTFEQRATKINDYLQKWEVVGFRAPYMHRNPEWMQALNIKYDLSFFDTDPYEPMAGGTMSIWPFLLGSFVELPYTLVQDHTLINILGERTPRLWVDKVDFIERWHGMALVNTHPDYLREHGGLAIYEEFLRVMKERENYWHALPQDVATWWYQRSQFQPECHNGHWNLSQLPAATLAHFLSSGEAATTSEMCSEHQ